MKKIILLVSSVLMSGIIEAQNVGINATGAVPNAAAGLDVDFTNKGVLIPRVALTARNSNAPIGAGIVTSLLVYNTATAGAFPNNVTPGYYYWNGTEWVRLVNGLVDGWQVTGNTLTGTLPATPNEFIGTLNNADWIVKTNNTERMRVKANGQVVVNSTAPAAGDIFSSYAAGTDYAVSSYASGSGGAIYGENSSTGYGVIGLLSLATNTNPAVYGSAPSIGVLGYETGANGLGVYGYASGTNAAGVYGYAVANNGTGVVGIGTPTVVADGVYGQAGNNQAFGVVAFNTNASGTGLIVGGNAVTSMSYQTNGSGIAATSTTFGIVSYGNASTGNGISASGNNLGIVSFANGGGGTFRGQTIGVYGIAASTAVNTWGGYFANGSAMGYAYVGGTDGAGTARKIVGGGTVSSILKDTNGKGVIITCPEAPEILIEDYGIGQLQNGKAHIDIDPIVAKNITVNEKHPLRVFIQLEGDCNGVYVTNKTQTGFDVVELNGGKSNVKFVYHIVGNRADEYDENGNLISRNADIRFSPAPPKLIPIEHESAVKKVNIPAVKEISIKKQR